MTEDGRKEIMGERGMEYFKMASCSVCCAPAAIHLHYGAIACYSCRAFFRRGPPKQTRCIFNQRGCNINPDNRTNCKKCRYDKCISVGMIPAKVDATKRKRESHSSVTEEYPVTDIAGNAEEPFSSSQVHPNRSPISEARLEDKLTEHCNKNKMREEIRREVANGDVNLHIPNYHMSAHNLYHQNLTRNFNDVYQKHISSTNSLVEKKGKTISENKSCVEGIVRPGLLFPRNTQAFYSDPACDIAHHRSDILPPLEYNEHIYRLEKEVKAKSEQILQRPEYFRDVECHPRPVNENRIYPHFDGAKERYGDPSLMIRTDERDKVRDLNSARVSVIQRDLGDRGVINKPQKWQNQAFPDKTTKESCHMYGTKSNENAYGDISRYQTISEDFPNSERAEDLQTEKYRCIDFSVNSPTKTGTREHLYDIVFDLQTKAQKEDTDEVKNVNWEKTMSQTNEYPESDDTSEDIIQVVRDASFVPLKKRQRMMEVPYSTEHAVNKRLQPIMVFTGEEAKLAENFKFRIHDYLNKRFAFLIGEFPDYAKHIVTYVYHTMQEKKIPFKKTVEQTLVVKGLEYTKRKINSFFPEMSGLKTEVRKEVLNSTYPALYVVFFAIMEGNTREKTWKEQHAKTLHITIEHHQALSEYLDRFNQVRSISVTDQARFTSPWAEDQEDEEKFMRTIAVLGLLLRDDVLLQSLFHTLVMVTPSQKHTSVETQNDPQLQKVQRTLVQLIYRYLSKPQENSGDEMTEHPRPEECSYSVMNLAKDVMNISPAEKTNLLIKLIDDVHDSARIMQRGTSSYGIKAEDVPLKIDDIEPSIA